eukprot:766133-Hanusia_phi.AAC.4
MRQGFIYPVAMPGVGGSGRSHLTGGGVEAVSVIGVRYGALWDSSGRGGVGHLQGVGMQVDAHGVGVNGGPCSRNAKGNY